MKKVRPLGVIAGMNTFGYVRGNPLTRTDKYGLMDWGLGGGSCCNNSSRTQWVIVGGTSEDGTGVWMPLQSGDCTGLTSDCDGMSCGGGFYRASNIQVKFLGAITCEDDENSQHDGESCSFAGEDRRWTPNQSGNDAQSPTSKGAATGNNPPSPNYPWLAAP